jgi:hypothetical protein
MEIFGRNPTPDKYSIKTIKLECDRNRARYVDDQTEIVIVTPYLLVELEPQPYFRDRFNGSSYETKKNPCSLRIELNELPEIQEAVTDGLRRSLQLLSENGQLKAFLHPEKASEATKKVG